MLEMLLKLVLDTNTILSAFLWKGNEAELFKKIEHEEARLYLSAEILKEIEDVLKRPKIIRIVESAGLTFIDIINKISECSIIVRPDSVFNICRDKKDNKFLDCAAYSNADYIVSGDEDLLSLKQVDNIRIIKTSEALRLMQ
jgi:uncharacterized protein